MGENVKTFTVKGYGLNEFQKGSNAHWQLAYRRAFQDFLDNLDKALDAEGL